MIFPCNENRLIILDRDGVINEDSSDFVKSPQEWLPISGSLEAISLFNQHQYKVFIATNQSGIARQLFSLEMLQLMHIKMQHLLKQMGGHVDGIYYCPHGPNDGCNCRKPKPGLFNKISEDFSVSLKNVPVVGDSLRDLEAGHTVGCLPILVKTGKGIETLKHPLPAESLVFENLLDFARAYVKEKSP